MLEQEDLDKIEEIVKKHNEDWSGWIMCVLLLFVFGFFKGCGY